MISYQFFEIPLETNDEVQQYIRTFIDNKNLTDLITIVIKSLTLLKVNSFRGFSFSFINYFSVDLGSFYIFMTKHFRQSINICTRI